MKQYENGREGANLTVLADRIATALPTDGSVDPLPGVRFFRASQTTERVYGVVVPAFCVIAQGAKEICLGDKFYRYDPQHYLLATMEMPVTGRVIEAEPEHPYLALRVELEPALVGSVMVEAALLGPQGKENAKALGISPLDSELLDAVVRLVRLLDTPASVRVLLPLVKREIVYRLLSGDQGQRLCHLPAPGGYSHRIAEALERLRQEFNRPLSIENLAKEMGMSSTRFHHHFKAVTTMSPLQFQKQLRLQEAHRLMLSEDLDATSAGFSVGYDNAAQFSREYKRFFGEPPMRNVQRLREVAQIDATNL